MLTSTAGATKPGVGRAAVRALRSAPMQPGAVRKGDVSKLEAAQSLDEQNKNPVNNEGF